MLYRVCWVSISFFIIISAYQYSFQAGVQAQEFGAANNLSSKIYAERLPQAGGSQTELTEQQRQILKNAEDFLRQGNGPDNAQNNTARNNAQRKDGLQENSPQGGVDGQGGASAGLRALRAEAEREPNSDIDIERREDRDLIENNDFNRQNRGRGRAQANGANANQDGGQQGQGGEQGNDDPSVARSGDELDRQNNGQQRQANPFNQQQNQINARRGALNRRGGVIGAIQPGRILNLDDAAFINGDNQNSADLMTQEEEQLYAPLGMRIGSFLLFSELSISSVNNDNILSLERNGPSDFAEQYQPRFTLSSDWVRHELEFTASANYSYYDRLSSENEEEWNVAGRTRIDITQNTNFSLEGFIAEEQDDRGDVDTISTNAERGTFQVSSITGTLNHRWNRLGLRLSGEYIEYDYDDTQTLANQMINNDDRDVKEIEWAARLGYFFHPGFQLFVEGAYDEREYEQSVDDNGRRRDSDGTRIGAGIGLDVTHKIYGEAMIGYRWIKAVDPLLADGEGLVFDANLRYRPSALTVLSFQAVSELEPTDLDNSIGSFTDSFEFTLRHSFRPNLILTSSLGYEVEDFEGIDVEQESWSFSLGAEYILTREVRLFANYTYTEVDTTDANNVIVANGAAAANGRDDGDYEENVFRVGVILRR